jgi:restriction endonuclease
VNAPQATALIDPHAYNALADALAVVFWSKTHFARLVQGALRGAPELVASLDFTATKRKTADKLVELLMAQEDRYRHVTWSLMATIAEMDSFPNLEAQRDRDRDERISVATDAVANLRHWIERVRVALDQRNSLPELRDAFWRMHETDDPRGRGLWFEGFLNRLFGLFDLNPRAAYSLDREQIDGAFTIGADDYILEARWWRQPVGREDLDVFKTKIDRKGKNALGLYVSVNGFTQDALEEYQARTPFLTMTGEDLSAVLAGRIRLDEVIRRKKRYANETGNCYFPVSRMLD